MSRAPQPDSAAATAAGGRNAYIDALRGWSIFGVVCVHFGGSFANPGNAWSPSFYLGLTLNQVFSFAVPLFVFLSGLLAGSPSRKAPAGLWAYYRGRFWRIGFPYLVASFAAFFLLNHYSEWRALPDNDARLAWLARGLFLYGVEPTLYFIPLIIQLYVVQPALKALPRWLSPSSPERATLGLTALFLVIHVTLGILCYRNVLNYYQWGRPDPLFWVFYFFAGLHFRTLATFASRRGLVGGAWAGLVLALAAMAWNGLGLTDRHLVGASFELSKVDYAYARPEILIFNLAMVASLATGIALAWNWRAGLASYLGRFSLEIYLWHIIVLYYGVWRYAEALESCRQMPELIVIVSATACFFIAGIFDGVPRLFRFVRQYRVLIVKAEGAGENA